MRGNDELKRERPITLFIRIAGYSSILFVSLILLFLLREGLPALGDVKLGSLLGARWYPIESMYGIWPLLGGSINFVIFVATGGIVFRKRISASIQGTAADDGPLQTEGSSGPLAEPGPPKEGGSPSKEPVVSSAL